jgi:hypothetical protein
MKASDRTSKTGTLSQHLSAETQATRKNLKSAEPVFRTRFEHAWYGTRSFERARRIQSTLSPFYSFEVHFKVILPFAAGSPN